MNTLRTSHRPAPLAAPRQIAPGVDFTLPEGELLHLAPAAVASRLPWRVQVQVGAVWITWAGCVDDVFLAAGESATVPAGVQALLQVEPRLARGAAVLQLMAAPDAGRADGRRALPWGTWRALRAR